jgi:carboxymethylenebutenolidase
MTTRALTTSTVDGLAEATLIVPEGTGPLPLVVFIPDAGGLRPAMTRMGERLSLAGFAVLQLNPYWRSGPHAPFDAKTVFSDPPERARLMSLMGAVKPANVMSDIEALVAAIPDARVQRERFGTLGYCMGGRLAFVAAGMLPARVVAAASIHGGGLVSDAPDSPHLLAPKIRAALYLGVADQDPSCTPEHQATLKAALDAASVRYQLELNPGARHGYAVPDFPVYDEPAAERHFERIVALFREHLGRS